MYIVRADSSTNRLYITLKGFLSESEARDAADAIILETTRLAPGFVVLVDITEFKPEAGSVTVHIKRAQLAAYQAGAKKVIRIVNNVISEMQFRRLQHEVGAQYETIEVSSVEEAEQLLAQWDQEG